MTVNLEPIANMLRGEAKLRTHSGKVLPGDVFVALSGLRTDGARFIDEAVSRGAAAVVHARKARISRREGVVYAVVDNSTRALGVLASARPSKRNPGCRKSSGSRAPTAKPPPRICCII